MATSGVLFTQLVSTFHSFSGPGYVSGVAPGILTVSSTPSARWVELRHRRSRIVMGTVFTDVDGTYLFPNIDPTQEYDLIARDWTGEFNDVIVSRVRPEPYDITTLTDYFVAGADALTGYLEVFGGLPGQTVAVTDGTAPAGITYAVYIITGNDGNATFAVTATGTTTTAGTYDWTLTITAPNGSSKDIILHKTFA